MSENKPKVYEYAVKSEGFNMWLCGKHVHAKNKVFTVDEKQNEELKGLIESGRYDISVELTYLDRNAAEAVALEFIKNQKGAAHQGSSHSGVAKKDETSVLPGNTIVPPGMTLQEKLRARRENILAPEQEKVNIPFTVIEEEAVHASDVAPASQAAE